MKTENRAPSWGWFVALVLILEGVMLALAGTIGQRGFDPFNLFMVGIFVLAPAVMLQLPIAIFRRASRSEVFNSWRPGLAAGERDTGGSGCLPALSNLLAGLIVSAVIAMALSFVLKVFL